MPANQQPGEKAPMYICQWGELYRKVKQRKNIKRHIKVIVTEDKTVSFD